MKIANFNVIYNTVEQRATLNNITVSAIQMSKTHIYFLYNSLNTIKEEYEVYAIYNIKEKCLWFKKSREYILLEDMIKYFHGFGDVFEPKEDEKFKKKLFEIIDSANKG